MSELTATTVQPYLRRCGYKARLLRMCAPTNGSGGVALVAFAHSPTDARTACIAVVAADDDPTAAVHSVRRFGTPLVFVCYADRLEWWKQCSGDPERLESVPVGKLDAFFSKNAQRFSPDTVYRAKLWGSFHQAYQLDFVDMGLMPVIESETGRRISRLIERAVGRLKAELGLETPSDRDAQWMIQSVFWLLAAKILQDKEVPAFADLDFADVEAIFSAVDDHYAAKAPLEVTTSPRLTALQELSLGVISRVSSLEHVTTESLAYVYENSLISKGIRRRLSVHSTPAHLVDYVVGSLRPLLEGIRPDQIDVFEPACGHAAFLVSAKRMLAEMLDPGRTGLAAQARLFRRRLHGSDVDAFALEIARLSLTLADIPNPDGWDLGTADVFACGVVQPPTRRCTLMLSNPPFEDFSEEERLHYEATGSELSCRNKAAELLWRTLPELRPGSVFGVVVPRRFLRSKDAAKVRELLATQCELTEVCLLPDGVFEYSAAESAVLIGRKATAGAKQIGTVRYRRVREEDTDRFKISHLVTAEQLVPQERFEAAVRYDLRVPDLDEVWVSCAHLPKMAGLVEVARGLEYVSEEEREERELPAYSDRRFPGAVKGFRTMKGAGQIHQLPESTYLSVDPAVIRRLGSAAELGRPQLVMNEARASRGPWCVCAFLDSDGHAVTANFMTLRLRDTSWPLECLWAILNSPFGNGFMHAHTGKRHITPSIVRAMPLPRLTASGMEPIAAAAQAYRQAASQANEAQGHRAVQERLRSLLLRLDAEVLRAYELPPRLERELLDLFGDRQRRGVGCAFGRYFPVDYEPCFALADYISDAYARSTAGVLRSQYRPVEDQELLEAMRRATEDFGE